MAFVRLTIILLAVLTVIYASLYYFLLERERERLHRDYPEGATERERSRFVEARVTTFAERLRPRLALAVYAVPVTALVVYIWVSN